MIGRFALLVICALPRAMWAQDLAFPAPATMTGRDTQPSGTLSIATGPWSASTGTPQRNIPGPVSRTAYRLAGATLSTQDLLAPLRAGLLAEGYDTVFECETDACGGFDFRYDLPLLPEPAMHVDLGDFRYFAASRRQGSAPEAGAMIVVSRSANAGFVQVNRVGGPVAPSAVVQSTTSAAGPAPPPALIAPAPVPPALATPAGGIGAQLEAGGAIALDDLVFPSGTATLATGDYASLAALASYLAANPNRQVAIVGHTDASGGLAANIALSRRRAESVRRVLIETLGASAAQVQAEGVGYLSPRASNLTEAGRTANRRVEVMLTSTE